MRSALPPAAHFHHPQHGTYASPSELLEDRRLSETQKQMAIEAWRSALRHGKFEEADLRDIRAAGRTLNLAASQLAAGDLY